MSRRARDMETPEQQYARRQAGAAAQRSREAAAKAYDQAQRDDNAVWAIGREGRRGYDPDAAAQYAASRDQNYDRAARYQAEAERHDAIASAPQPKKRGWWR
ncbi:hypothetical protein OG552_10615 [Streptomyces sp. NBC_01476]|uniref:hypothetical protein n=1 Tax=Streptomyces sp. NBC_01476 TaxID=2903881 RepID=UPI002E2FF109|nr:hypothetical protein [Streptomyces sp. NBC_01476]